MNTGSMNIQEGQAKTLGIWHVLLIYCLLWDASVFISRFLRYVTTPISYKKSKAKLVRPALNHFHGMKMLWYYY